MANESSFLGFMTLPLHKRKVTANRTVLECSVSDPDSLIPDPADYQSGSKQI